MVLSKGAYERRSIGGAGPPARCRVLRLMHKGTLRARRFESTAVCVHSIALLQTRMAGSISSAWTCITGGLHQLKSPIIDVSDSVRSGCSRMGKCAFRHPAPSGACRSWSPWRRA